MNGEPGPDVGHLSHPGRHRQRNEDTYGLPPPGLSPEMEAAKGRLYVVADGVGGHQGGDEASRIAVERIRQEYYRDPSPDWQQSLVRAIHLANAAVFQLGVQAQGLRRPATTMTAAVVRGPDLLAANVGDSRVYLLRGAAARQITHDHTPVADGIRNGLIDPARASTHPQQGQITRALGKDRDVLVDVFSQRLESGDRILLCSDGLTNEVTDDQIVSIVSRSQSAQQAASGLVGMANQNGGRDNVTALVVSLNGPQARAASPLPVGLMAAVGAALSLVLVVVVLYAVWPRQPSTSTALITVPVVTVPTTSQAATGAMSGLATTPIPTPGTSGLATTPIPTPGTPGTTVIENAALTTTAEAQTASAKTQTATALAQTAAAEAETRQAEESEPAPEETEPQPAPATTEAPPSAEPEPGDGQKAIAPPMPTPYPVPKPWSPSPDAIFQNQDTIKLVWEWEGDLAEDERFDVLVWREGGQPDGGVAGPKVLEHPLHLPSLPEYLLQPDIQGVYFWRIAVVRERGGIVTPLALSEERSFEYKVVSEPGQREIEDD